MTKTYYRTMFNPDLTKAKVKLYTYKECKYTEDITEEIETTYKGLKSWSIITEPTEEEEKEFIENNMVDEFHEYLILNFEDGSTASFRNSHCDLFIL